MRVLQVRVSELRGVKDGGQMEEVEEVWIHKEGFKQRSGSVSLWIAVAQDLEEVV